MKKLKNFQKFALSAEKSNNVRGGAVDWADDPQTSWTCHYGDGEQLEFHDEDFNGKGLEAALSFCSGSPSCAGCF